MLVLATRRKRLPAPPHVVHESLRQPNRDPARRWLHLYLDEVWPIISTPDQNTVIWISIWRRRPDIKIQFQVSSDEADGTWLRFVITAEEEEGDPIVNVGRRMSRLIFAELRYCYGQ